MFGPTAAAVHPFDGYRLDLPFHVGVPRGRHVNRVGHVIHTIRDMERIDLEVRDGLPISSPTRTIIDLAAMATPKQLTIAIDGATRDGTTSDDFLHRRLVELRRRGRGGIGTLLAALQGIEVQRGGQSWLERAFLELLADRRMPRPDTQRVLAKRGTKLIRVDCTFPGTNIVVELLGYAFHRTLMQMQSDAERMNRLQFAGFVVMQFTYLDVVGASPLMLDTITAALSR